MGSATSGLNRLMSPTRVSDVPAANSRHEERRSSHRQGFPWGTVKCATAKKKENGRNTIQHTTSKGPKVRRHPNVNPPFRGRPRKSPGRCHTGTGMLVPSNWEKCERFLVG